MIHPEGRVIVSVATLIVAVVVFFLLRMDIAPWNWIAVAAILLVYSIIIRFFRNPERELNRDPDTIYSPADGTVVVIEQTDENEFFHDKRIQVSVFMSLWNVHVNWYPIGGKVIYQRHHHGAKMVAWHPKSSELNERTTVVVEHNSRKILFRQIAGFVARRIVSYAREGQEVDQTSQCGFIKFGSRVDIFLPLDAEIKVELNQRVRGTDTVIATLKK
jgi:phosphatidylserine decarboxylase